MTCQSFSDRMVVMAIAAASSQALSGEPMNGLLIEPETSRQTMVRFPVGATGWNDL
jgi:hypothetical protein